MFFGHDHLNHFSLTYDGIRLTYGRSIDYLAYPGIEGKIGHRGGTWIVIHKDLPFIYILWTWKRIRKKDRIVKKACEHMFVHMPKLYYKSYHK